MPFRSNHFGDKIAQPGTDWAEIDNVLIDSLGIIAASPTGADLYLNGEDDFKFGGILYVSGESLEDGEISETEITFDGFETFDDAKAWLVGLDDGSFDITEVA